jgi:transcriptional regulator with XRE-family HTH domain
MRINPTALSAWRQERGLTRSALAKAVKCPQPHISRLEMGEREPSWSLLTKIADKLDVDVRVLIGPDETAFGEASWPHARGRKKAA